MEKWRIFTLLGGLGLGVLAALLGWWLFSPIENESYFWQILRFLALIVAYFFAFFSLFLFFYPFFVGMEDNDGSKSFRNQFIFFLVLLCLPVLYLVFYPKQFVNGYYSWIALIVFGYGTMHALFLYVKNLIIEKEEEEERRVGKLKMDQITSYLNVGKVEEAMAIADSLFTHPYDIESHCLIAQYHWDRESYENCFSELQKIADAGHGASYAIKKLLIPSIENNWADKKKIVLENLEALFKEDERTWQIKNLLEDLIELKEIDITKKIMQKVTDIRDDKELLALIQEHEAKK